MLCSNLFSNHLQCIIIYVSLSINVSSLSLGSTYNIFVGGKGKGSLDGGVVSLPYAGGYNGGGNGGGMYGYGGGGASDIRSGE